MPEIAFGDFTWFREPDHDRKALQMAYNWLQLVTILVLIRNHSDYLRFIVPMMGLYYGFDF